MLLHNLPDSFLISVEIQHRRTFLYDAMFHEIFQIHQVSLKKINVSTIYCILLPEISTYN